MNSTITLSLRALDTITDSLCVDRGNCRERMARARTAHTRLYWQEQIDAITAALDEIERQRYPVATTTPRIIRAVLPVFADRA